MIILHARWKLNGDKVRLRVFVGPAHEYQPQFRYVGELMLNAAEFIQISQGQFQPEYEEDVDDQSPNNG